MYIGHLISLYVFLAAVLSAGLGFLRGTRRALIRLLTVVLAVVLTFFLSIPITNALCDADISFLGISYGDTQVDTFAHAVRAMTESNRYFSLIAQDPGVAAALEHIPYYLTAPLGFMVSFLLCLLFTLLICLIVDMVGRLHRPDRPKPALASRFGGMGIGLVQGLLCLLMLSPLAAMQAEAQEVTTDLQESGVQMGYTADALQHPVITSFPASAGAWVGERYLRSASSYTVSEETYSLRDDFPAMVKTYRILTDFDLSRPDTALCQQLSVSMMKSRVLRQAMPDFLRAELQTVFSSLGTAQSAAQVYDRMIARISAVYQEADIDFWLIGQERDALPDDVQLRWDTQQEKYQALISSLCEIFITYSDTFTETDASLLSALSAQIVTELAKQETAQADAIAAGRAMQQAAAELARGENNANAAKLRTLYSAESFSPGAVTLEQLTVRGDIYQRMTEEDLEKEISALSRVLFGLCELQRDGGRIESRSLATLAENMRSSISLHNTAKNVLIALSQCEAFADRAEMLCTAAAQFDHADFYALFAQ